MTKNNKTDNIEMVCPICGEKTRKYAWVSYGFVYDNGYMRKHIDYCCHDCIKGVEYYINQRQAGYKAKIENIGVTTRKGVIDE